MGACLAAIGATLVWQFYPGFWKESPDTAHDIALQRRQALQEAQQQAASARPASMQLVAAPTRCELDPVMPPSDAQDGHALVEHPFPGGPRAKAKVFLRQAVAAANQGRLRDAEVALLAACRENDAASAKPSVPLARVLGMLGDHYAAAAAENTSVLRERLMGRAQHVLSLSAQAYASALGPNAPRSRQARQRLATLEQDILAAADVPQLESARPHDDADPDKANGSEGSRSGPPRQVVSVRTGRTDPQPVRQRWQSAPVAQQANPEPEHQRAGIESHPELKQLASDLARLQAQAAAVSEDPAGLRRRAEAAQAERDRCQSAACARDWHVKRRRELLTEF